jgi:hypothetical protein
MKEEVESKESMEIMKKLKDEFMNSIIEKDNHFMNHSCISEYPPDVNYFPNYYNAKCGVHVLHPGDCLYIPKYWNHWVFSYPDVKSETKENIAASFPIIDFKGKVSNKFSNFMPFLSRISEDCPFFDITWDYLLETIPDIKTIYYSSKTSHIISFINRQKEKSISEIHKLVLKNDTNISLSQNEIYGNIKPPKFYTDSFPSSVMKSYLWFSFCKSKKPIDTGLHNDDVHSILVQIKGIKVVRLYPPNEYDKLYMSQYNN